MGCSANFPVGSRLSRQAQADRALHGVWRDDLTLLENLDATFTEQRVSDLPHFVHRLTPSFASDSASHLGGTDGFLMPSLFDESDQAIANICLSWAIHVDGPESCLSIVAAFLQQPWMYHG